MPSRTSSSLGFGLSFTRSIEAMIIPGVQNPHCRPCISWKAFCIGCRVPLERDPLDRRDLAAVGLDGQDGAALHGLAVEVHGAGAAVAGVAPDDGADLAELLPQVVDEQRPRFDVVDVGRAVDPHVDLGHAILRSEVWPRSLPEYTAESGRGGRT